MPSFSVWLGENEVRFMKLKAGRRNAEKVEANDVLTRFRKFNFAGEAARAATGNRTRKPRGKILSFSSRGGCLVPVTATITDERADLSARAEERVLVRACVANRFAE